MNAHGNANVTYMSNCMEIAVDATNEWRALGEAMSNLEEPTPCQDEAGTEHDRFFHEAKDVQLEAAKLCDLYCPVAYLCGQYAKAAREKKGVWGGMTEWDRDTSRTGTGRRGRPKTIRHLTLVKPVAA